MQMTWFTTSTVTCFTSLVIICHEANDDDITTTTEYYCLKIMYTRNVRMSKCCITTTLSKALKSSIHMNLGLQFVL